jgi:hypothetical protein
VACYFVVIDKPLALTVPQSAAAGIIIISEQEAASRGLGLSPVINKPLGNCAAAAISRNRVQLRCFSRGRLLVAPHAVEIKDEQANCG